MRYARVRSLRRTVALSGLVIAALVIGGCSNNDTATESSSSDFETVTIESALGKAVITEKPERIVTLGMGSAETVIALGTIPVGVENYAWGSDDTGYLPWVHEAVTKQGGELPEQFTGGTDLNIEAIIALEPDLILAPWSGITQQQFDSLNAFAPTVAYAESPWTITWERPDQRHRQSHGRIREGDSRNRQDQVAVRGIDCSTSELRRRQLLLHLQHGPRNPRRLLRRRAARGHGPRTRLAGGSRRLHLDGI